MGGAGHTEVTSSLLMMIMQQKPLYKQFIYSKQQHRQTPYKHKGSDAETQRWLTVDLRLVSNTSRALGEEAVGRGRSDFLFRAAS